MSQNERAVSAFMRVWLLCIATSLLIVLGSCKDNGPIKDDTYTPKKGTIKVKAHVDDAREGLYCKYRITKKPVDGAMNVGDLICILCDADKQGCDDYDKVEDSDGKVYEVKAEQKGLPCDKCPKGTDSPPGYPKEPAK